MALVLAILLILLTCCTACLLLSNTDSTQHKSRQRELVAKIDSLLPQTQCRACTFQGCRPYAHAIVDGTADINQCPPGGEATVKLIAQLLGRQSKPLDPAYGMQTQPEVAIIDEAACIGCVKCILACPVDAIIGTAKHMHTVIPKYCTGCKLCVAPCPVDCISIVAKEVTIKKWVWHKPSLAFEDKL